MRCISYAVPVRALRFESAYELEIRKLFPDTSMQNDGTYFHNALLLFRAPQSAPHPDKARPSHKLQDQIPSDLSGGKQKTQKKNDEVKSNMMIRDLLKDKNPHISFEIFPPKTDAGYESVLSATLNNFIPVTLLVIIDALCITNRSDRKRDRRIERYCRGL